MRKVLVLVVCLVCIISFSSIGCGPKKASSVQSAVKTAKTMQTVNEKVDYLISQAKAFYNSKDFQGTVDIAQYILSFLDSDSQAAKDLLAKAQQAVTDAAKGAVEDVKGKLGSLGQ
jgi:hypothetical protein